MGDASPGAADGIPVPRGRCRRRPAGACCGGSRSGAACHQARGSRPTMPSSRRTPGRSWPMTRRTTSSTGSTSSPTRSSGSTAHDPAAGRHDCRQRRLSGAGHRDRPADATDRVAVRPHERGRPGGRASVRARRGRRDPARNAALTPRDRWGSRLRSVRGRAACQRGAWPRRTALRTASTGSGPSPWPRRTTSARSTRKPSGRSVAISAAVNSTS